MDKTDGKAIGRSAGFILFEGQLHEKRITAVFALRPDPAPVPQDDILGDGKTQTVAAPLGVGFVGAVEALENVLQIRPGDRRAGVGHCQAAPPAAAGEGA